MYTKKSQQRGFTLIELMIVVAIVGILAAIAVPAYQNYIIRARVSELVTVADALRTTVAEFRVTTGAWPADIDEAGATSAVTANVASSAVAANVITVVGDNNGLGIPVAADVPTITMTGTANGDGSVTWVCSVGANVGAYKYVPSNCRS